MAEYAECQNCGAPANGGDYPSPRRACTAECETVLVEADDWWILTAATNRHLHRDGTRIVLDDGTCRVDVTELADRLTDDGRLNHDLTPTGVGEAWLAAGAS